MVPNSVEALFTSRPRHHGYDLRGGQFGNESGGAVAVATVNLSV